jgi:hypothetical protein
MIVEQKSGAYQMISSFGQYCQILMYFCYFIPKNGQPKMMQGALPKNELVNIINKDLLGK